MTEKVTPKKLTPKQARGVAALLSESTIMAAAEKAGVTPKTIYKWLQQPAFKAGLQAAQTEAIDTAVRRLVNGLEKALDTLDHLMVGAKDESIKRQAASQWVTHALKLRELVDLEARVVELEKRL